MKVIILFISFANSLFQAQNLTINHLTVTKYLDHSPLFSFSNGFSTSSINLSFLLLRKFFSPIFLYYSSYHTTKISNSYFQQFISTSLFIDGQLYENQSFTNSISASTSTDFIMCTFQIDLSQGHALILYDYQYHFKNCNFVNSNLSDSSFIFIINSNVTINNSIFSENTGIGSSKIIRMDKDLNSDIIIDSTNFSNNGLNGKVAYISGITIKVSNCNIISNNCSMGIFDLEPNPDSIINLNNVIMIKNQIKFKNPSEINLIIYNQQNSIYIDHLIINEAVITAELSDYYHFSFSKLEPIIHLSNCCLSNPKENWIQGKFVDDGGNSENDDCFDINLKNIHYGIIAEETIEFQIPKKLHKYFFDTDQE